MSKIVTTGTRIEPVIKPQAKIILEMREEVAETLSAILYNVGGPVSGRRGHAQELSNALLEAGIGTTDKSPAAKDVQSGGVYFR